MIYILIGVFALYSVYKAFLSILQIKFISQNATKKAVVLSQEDYEKAAIIAIKNEKFSLASNIFSFILLVFWSLCGANLLQNLFNDGLFGNTIFCVAFLVINSLFHIPFEIYERFVKDKKFGFSTITPKLFVIDLFKSLALIVIFGGIFIYLLLWIFESLGEFWWIWGFCFAFCMILLINLIYPTLIAPIFNKMTPLNDENLTNSINSLLESCGFKSSGVFVMDASKRDNRLNAYFGGLGSTKRVVLFDTLIKKLTQNEILAVLGHELGHFKHKDLLKNIVLMGVVLFVVFFVLGNIPSSFYTALNLKENGGALIVFFLLYSPVLSAIFEPLISAFSRSHEFGADKFGADNTNKNDMILALKKLGSENKAFPISHKIYSFVYHSHPSLFERINELENS